MDPKEVTKEHIYTSSFDKKIINLTILFFALSTVLFIISLFKLHRPTNTMPFSQQRDYVVFEKYDPSVADCKDDVPCVEIIKVYRSGKVIALGRRMYVDILTWKELDNFLATIDGTGIFNSNCDENKENVTATTNSSLYTIKSGVQIKKTTGDMCSDELSRIETELF